MKKVKIQKDVEVKDKKVTADELKKLNALENQRNMLALNMGIVTYNWQKVIDEYKSQLDKVKEEQMQLGTLILSLYDCDAKKQNFNIDLKTGLITVI